MFLDLLQKFAQKFNDTTRVPQVVRTHGLPGVGHIKASGSVTSGNSMVQVALQPSPAVALPSSHFSSPTMMPAHCWALMAEVPLSVSKSMSTSAAGMRKGL